jgi:beta-lactamase regulating signal transducer with metallopeptidase domain
MQGIFQKENTDKALKYGIYRHLPTYEKIIRNLVSFYNKKTEIWVCENQDFYSPMLFGVRNTKVLIPQEMLETENYSYEEWYLIFLHELTHQKKHDLWYKRFLQIIRDVYWFCIPMLWVQKMANIDIECVCDETVTKHMNLTQRKDYCNVILKVASKQTKKELSGVVSMVSETEILKERFYNVFLARKKLRIYVTVFLFGRYLA